LILGALFLGVEKWVMKKQQSNHICDVLIIGGSSAGLRDALEAHDTGANVLIISKSKTGDPHKQLQEAVSMPLLALWIQKITG